MHVDHIRLSLLARTVGALVGGTLGFSGKSASIPSQIVLAHAAHSAPEDEVRMARAILALMACLLA